MISGINIINGKASLRRVNGAGGTINAQKLIRMEWSGTGAKSHRDIQLKCVEVRAHTSLQSENGRTSTIVE